MIEYIKKNTNQLIIGAMVVSIIFIMIGHIYKEQIQTVLKQPLYKIKESYLDWWSVSHFMLFAFFGFVKPNYAFTFFMLGSLFEVIEDGMASDSTTQLMNCTDNNVKRTFTGSIFCKGYDDSYWYGKLDDIVINLIGYCIGQGLRLTYYPV